MGFDLFDDNFNFHNESHKIKTNNNENAIKDEIKESLEALKEIDSDSPISLEIIKNIELLANQL